MDKYAFVRETYTWFPMQRSIMYTNIYDQIMSQYMTKQVEPLSSNQKKILRYSLKETLAKYKIKPRLASEFEEQSSNSKLLQSFLAAKTIEGCSKKTLHYYEATITDAITAIGKPIIHISTDNLRSYLAHIQSSRNVSQVTLDNIRRIFSTFFAWLENEDYILKSPVRKIHKVKILQAVKETITDEEIERIREACSVLRDLAMVDMLFSTGMRVGELVLLNREDINFQERECTVLGKGNKERIVYFDAKAKMHLLEYLKTRTDSNTALFASLKAPHERMTISAIELRIKQIGKKAINKRIYPHMFRRTLATMAIDKGMPIEQVQTLLGHVKIDTTLHYAMVNQQNVKISHRKYIE